VAALFLPVLLWMNALPLPAAAPEAVVTDLRVGKHAKKTRVVLALTERVRFRAFTLANPYRVVIDLPEVGWRLPTRPLPARTGLVKKLRYGLFKPGQTRLVLDMAGPVTITKSFLMEPSAKHAYRLVLDLTATSREKALAAARGPVALTPPAAPPPAPVKAPVPSVVPVVAGKPLAKPAGQQDKGRAKRVIAIDPGHGGVDPGATGASGVYEKHITLAVGRAIKGALEDTGRYRVVLTRDRDIFKSLRDRVELARQAGAELFVSIHADTIKKRKIRGLSVYTLSETASDKEAAALAEKENKADLIAGIDLSNETSEVTNILIDLAQRETMNESARFASVALKELGRVTKLLRNTHRFAGFAVLKAPDVPSVLVELGFLSNRRDEKALRRKEHRAKLAKAITRAVGVYFARVEEASRK
jgi:N-acetylmuramoyl-L-alanine amidase